MTAEIHKRIEEIDRQIGEKFAEIKDLKALKKSYMTSQKLEQKVFKKKTGTQTAEGQQSEQ
ncbi:MAG: hypothetical protein ABII64_02000 [Elusimicrobiota bacterium]